ncbi:MAG: zinc-ribbon domain-containing protein [Lachnospiraceae bacterium]|nr:zinc-ribbon domain-containing protein [Lachnospiraceae bacterium]
MRTLAEVHPELIHEWSDKNMDLAPNTVSYGSNKKVYWKGRCGHVWEATVKNRANGHGCPFCSGNRILQGFNDLASMYPELAAEWSERNAAMNPRNVTVRSIRRVWWHCSTCGQEWQARIADRSAGSGCPVCAGGRLVAGINDLATEHPELVAEWSVRNLRTPDAYWSKSREKVWWHCSVCDHDWQAVIDSRVKGHASCPICAARKLDEKNRRLARISSRAFQRDAVRYYAEAAGLRVLQDDDSVIGIPLQLFIPEKQAAVEFSRPFDCTGSGRFAENAKNWLCINAGIRLIRILAPDANEFDNCICITRTDNSVETINEAIQAALTMTGLDAHVDILRDMTVIDSGETA